jgi:hypothetical protein
VREQGGGAAIHGNPGRHPAKAAGEAIKAKIIALKKSGAYQQANFTYFRELLEEYEQITIVCQGYLKRPGLRPPGHAGARENGERGGSDGQSLANRYKCR